MKGAIKRISVSGFKSISDLNGFELKDLNIVIGANGAGKSNLVQLFQMLMAMARKNLQKFILENGGGDNFLHNGPKHTSSINVDLEFTYPIKFASLSDFARGPIHFRFALTPTVDETFLIAEERGYVTTSSRSYGSSSLESRLYDERNERSSDGRFAYESIPNWMVYHFHDTSSTAPMRRSEIVEDRAVLRNNGSNIAPFLLKLKNTDGCQKHYQETVNAIRLVIPFFDDFRLDVFQQGSQKRSSWAGSRRAPIFRCSPITFRMAPFVSSAWRQRFCNRHRHQPLSLMSRSWGCTPRQFEYLGS